jgi:hypothetical protein
MKMKTRLRIVIDMSLALLLLIASHPRSAVADSGAPSLPSVQLSATRGGPRELEDLTRQKMLRDYALAWQTLAIAMEQNRPGVVNEYFAGFANKRFSKAIKEQAASGIHRHFVDHGHKLELIFYSPDGGVMQLWDNADYEVQTFDGTKLIHSEHAPARFLVLMTPGADRWMVRLMQDVPASK